MSRITPRDVHIGTVVGGCIIALTLSGVGILDFVAAFGAGPKHWVFAFEGAVCRAIGSAFGLISAILLPAWRTLQLERAGIP
jgi:hypothetical protein